MPYYFIVIPARKTYSVRIFRMLRTLTFVCRTKITCVHTIIIVCVALFRMPDLIKYVELIVCFYKSYGIRKITYAVPNGVCRILKNVCVTLLSTRTIFFFTSGRLLLRKRLLRKLRRRRLLRRRQLLKTLFLRRLRRRRLLLRRLQL